MISYKIASGFLPSDFQTERGSIRGTAPNMYISRSAMEKLVDHPSIFRVEIQSDGKEDANILTYLKDITAESSSINILSRYEKAEEIRGYLVTTRVLGIDISIILFLIGFMNFVNTMYASVMVRHKEFAVLESIGMMKKQMKRMLVYEGLIYAIITLLLVGGIGSSILYVTFVPLKAVSGYAVFTYPISSMVAISMLILLVCVFIPLISYKSIASQSIVQRLRDAE